MSSIPQIPGKIKITEAILVKCLQDPAYFVDTFCMIEVSWKGLVPFKAFEYQKTALQWYKTWKPIYILKSRQLWFTTLAAAFALWKSIFPWNNILLLSKGEEYAQMILRKIRIMYENLPKELQSALLQSNQTTLEFKNKNMIKSLPATERAWAWFTAWLVIIDEFSWFPWAKSKMPGADVWASIAPTLSTWWQIIVQSTPFWTWNKFYDIFSQKNSFLKLKFHWTHHPVFGKDKTKRKDPTDGWWEWESPWSKEQRTIWYTTSDWAQEFDCEFLQSWRPVFDIKYLVVLPVRPETDLHYMWRFACGVDLASWSSIDWSVAQFVNVDTGQVVETYRSQEPIDVFAQNVMDKCRKYNEALLSFETNSWYWLAFIPHIQDYPNLFYQIKYDKVTEKKTRKVGFTTTNSTKQKAIRDLQLALQNQKIRISDTTTLNEMKVYQYVDENKMEAAQGFNDDCVMSLAIAWQAVLSEGWADDASYTGGRTHKIGQRIAPTVNLQWQIEQEQNLIMPKMVKDWRR